MVVWGWTVMVPLVDGWPFPRSWSVAYHSACEVPVAVWSCPSIRRGLQFPVVVMQTRIPILPKTGSIEIHMYGGLSRRFSPDCCWHYTASLHSVALVWLGNRWDLLGCWMNVVSWDASSGPETAALYPPSFGTAVDVPLAHLCPGCDWVFCPLWEERTVNSNYCFRYHFATIQPACDTNETSIHINQSITHNKYCLFIKHVL